MPDPTTATSLADLIDHRPAEGVFQVHRDAYRDAGIHELEIRHLFEGGWVFVGLASAQPAMPPPTITTS